MVTAIDNPAITWNMTAFSLRRGHELPDVPGNRLTQRATMIDRSGMPLSLYPSTLWKHAVHHFGDSGL
jgi:hypothetical protein